MTIDMLLILTAAACAGYGTFAAARRKRDGVKPALIAVATLLFVLAGCGVVFWVFSSGDGRVYPGSQLNPDSVARLLSASVSGPLGLLSQPLFGLAAVLAHLLLWAPQPNRRGVFGPLPASLGFLLLLTIGQGRLEGDAIRHERVLGLNGAAYLTIVPTGNGARVLVARGDTGDFLLDLLYVHETRGRPPQARLEWTRDHAAIVVSFRRQALLGIEPDGTIVGALPSEEADWPSQSPTTQSVSTRELLSEARMLVSKMVSRHDRDPPALDADADQNRDPE